MKATVNNFNKINSRINEIQEAVSTMDKRLELGDTVITSLKKEFTKLAKKGNVICENMTEDDFHKLGDLCMDYDTFIEGMWEDELIIF